MWRSRVQETTADSSNAAEYIALWKAAKAILGIANITWELAIDTTLPTMYEDNLGALCLAKAGMGQEKARHLNSKYHAVQDWAQEKRIQIEYVRTTRQVADLLTKGVHSEATLTRLVRAMGLVMGIPTEGPPIRGSDPSE